MLIDFDGEVDFFEIKVFLNNDVVKKYDLNWWWCKERFIKLKWMFEISVNKMYCLIGCFDCIGIYFFIFINWLVYMWYWGMECKDYFDWLVWFYWKMFNFVIVYFG